MAIIRPNAITLSRSLELDLDKPKLVVIGVDNIVRNTSLARIGSAGFEAHLTDSECNSPTGTVIAPGFADRQHLI
jgi:hypothetical protein